MLRALIYRMCTNLINRIALSTVSHLQLPPHTALPHPILTARLLPLRLLIYPVHHLHLLALIVHLVYLTHRRGGLQK